MNEDYKVKIKRLEVQVAELKRELDDCREAVQVLSALANEKQEQLAAAQARIVELRKALEYCHGYAEGHADLLAEIKAKYSMGRLGSMNVYRLPEGEEK